MPSLPPPLFSTKAPVEPSSSAAVGAPDCLSRSSCSEGLDTRKDAEGDGAQSKSVQSEFKTIFFFPIKCATSCHRAAWCVNSCWFVLNWIDKKRGFRSDKIRDKSEFCWVFLAHTVNVFLRETRVICQCVCTKAETKLISRITPNSHKLVNYLKCVSWGRYFTAHWLLAKKKSVTWMVISWGLKRCVASNWSSVSSARLHLLLNWKLFPSVKETLKYTQFYLELKVSSRQNTSLEAGK